MNTAPTTAQQQVVKYLFGVYMPIESEDLQQDALEDMFHVPLRSLYKTLAAGFFPKQTSDLYRPYPLAEIAWKRKIVFATTFFQLIKHELVFATKTGFCKIDFIVGFPDTANN